MKQFKINKNYTNRSEESLDKYSPFITLFIFTALQILSNCHLSLRVLHISSE